MKHPPDCVVEVGMWSMGKVREYNERMGVGIGGVGGVELVWVKLEGVGLDRSSGVE